LAEHLSCRPRLHPLPNIDSPPFLLIQFSLRAEWLICRRTKAAASISTCEPLCFVLRRDNTEKRSRSGKGNISQLRTIHLVTAHNENDRGSLKSLEAPHSINNNVLRNHFLCIRDRDACPGGTFDEGAFTRGAIDQHRYFAGIHLFLKHMPSQLLERCLYFRFFRLSVDP